MPHLLPDPAYFASLPKVISSGAVILRDEHGRIHSGFNAVLAIWTRLGYHRAVAVFAWPPVFALCETLYDHVVAPSLAYWARVRQPGAST